MLNHKFTHKFIFIAQKFSRKYTDIKLILVCSLWIQLNNDNIYFILTFSSYTSISTLTDAQKA